ncbi:MAG: hypothetical protein ACREBQ_08720, partial [Nitrososphaerales archaeon]
MPSTQSYSRLIEVRGAKLQAISKDQGAVRPEPGNRPTMPCRINLALMCGIGLIISLLGAGCSIDPN